MRQEDLRVAGARNGGDEDLAVGPRLVPESDVEVGAAVVDIVLDVVPALEHRLELPVGAVGFNKADVARDCAPAGDEDVLLAPGAVDADVEGVVLLVEDELVLLGIAPDRVAPHLVGAVELVLGDVEQRLVVVGPHDVARGVGDGPRQQLPPSGDVLHAHRELLPALSVLRVREEPLVWGDLEPADHVEAVLGGLFVLVEENLFRLREVHLLGRGGCAGARRDPPAASDPVLRVLEGPAVVVVPAVAHGDRLIVLLDPPPHLLEQRLLQAVRVREHGPAVRRLGGEVLDHRRVLPLVVPQPVVRVLAHLARGLVLELHGDLLGNGRAEDSKPHFFHFCGCLVHVRGRGRNKGALRLIVRAPRWPMGEEPSVAAGSK
mmetsp:Transcript_20381/g.48534  ORF Transcript_20381/g.48534 Transcript_20381/m.48534 type:complete len:376 (+) Transcript_20381:1356-2483(+)